MTTESLQQETPKEAPKAQEQPKQAPQEEEVLLCTICHMPACWKA